MSNLAKKSKKVSHNGSCNLKADSRHWSRYCLDSSKNLQEIRKTSRTLCSDSYCVKLLSLLTFLTSYAMTFWTSLICAQERESRPSNSNILPSVSTVMKFQRSGEFTRLLTSLLLPGWMTSSSVLSSWKDYQLRKILASLDFGTVDYYSQKHTWLQLVKL